MEAVLTGSGIGSRTKRCILTNRVVPKLKHAGKAWEGNAKSIKQMETVQLKKVVLGFSSTTSSTVLRAELEMCPLKTTRGMRKLKWQHRVKSAPKKRLPAIVDRAVWEKVTTRRAGIRWDNVVENPGKDKGGRQDDIVSAEKFGRHETEEL